MESCLSEKSDITDTIIRFSKAEIAATAGDSALRDELTVSVQKTLIAASPVFADTVFLEDGQERFDWLSEHITYMYR